MNTNSNDPNVCQNVFLDELLKHVPSPTDMAVMIGQLKEEEVAMNIRIAEFCGWQRSNQGGGDYWALGVCSRGYSARELPNYCGDLNAISDAERTLNEAWYSLYEEYLFDILTEKLERKMIDIYAIPYGRIREISARAKDRAKAMCQLLDYMK